MVTTDVIAVIPARGGSKRIPNKNIIDFFGKPLLAHTIDAAKNSKIFTAIVVSTDDSGIAKVARDYGAHVYNRSDRADDFIGVEQATLEVLKDKSFVSNLENTTVVQMLPTTPLRSANTIINAHDFFVKKNISYLISCFNYGWMNPWWAMVLDQDNNSKALFEDKIVERSQDLPKLYCPSGAIWIAKAKKLLEKGTFYASGYKAFPMDWKEAVDIDDYQDLEMAKIIYQVLNKVP
jgi:CMP-N-acetylneuraminic acid synthetase